VANAFISQTLLRKVILYTTALLCFPLKTLYPGGIRTQVFLFLRRMLCPLRPAAGHFKTMFITAFSTMYMAAIVNGGNLQKGKMF
jgi:hypothetical protein